MRQWHLVRSDWQVTRSLVILEVGLQMVHLVHSGNGMIP